MIRTMQPADAGAMTQIYNEYIAHTTVTFETEEITHEEMRRRLGEILPAFPAFVWTDGSCLLGYAYAHRWREREAYRHTWETTVYVAPDCAGRGIGRQLMQCLIEACRAAGAHALVACITACNAPSCRLHERLGFQKVSTFRQVGRKFGQWLDVVDYELLLSGSSDCP